MILLVQAWFNIPLKNYYNERARYVDLVCVLFFEFNLKSPISQGSIDSTSVIITGLYDSTNFTSEFPSRKSRGICVAVNVQELFLFNYSSMKS